MPEVYAASIPLSLVIAYNGIRQHKPESHLTEIFAWWSAKLTQFCDPNKHIYKGYNIEIWQLSEKLCFCDRIAEYLALEMVS